MDLQPRLQVVLGEAARTDGLLLFVLEGEGFDIVGLASDDDELARVLRGARPTVIVLDGGISATAALEARRTSPGAALVVVWPDGVSAVLAEERVDPHLVIPDLGEAVRKAARRAEPIVPRIRVPESQSLQVATTVRVRPVAPPRRNDSPKPARTPRRGSRLLVAAATWMLILAALGTIAVAVPKAFDLDLFPERAPRPVLSGSVNRGADDPRIIEIPSAPERTGGSGQPATCDAPAARNDPTDRVRGRSSSDPVRARGCPPDRGKGKDGKGTHEKVKDGKVTDGKVKDGKVKDGKVKSGGRPDDPGSQANGGGPPSQEPGAARDGKDGSPGSGGEGQGQEAVGSVKSQKHERSENGGRS